MRKRIKKNPLVMYSVDDINEKYDFHPNTIRAWVHRDGLRHYRKGRGDKIYIREDDLKDFLATFYEP